MQYIRRPNDVQFRRVLLTKSDEPEFENFTSDSQLINYPDTAVLEIRQNDGKTRLEYGLSEKKSVNYLKRSGQICLSSSVPTARLWVRDNAGGVEYKVPTGLPSGTDGNIRFLLPECGNDVVLIGDKYFCKVYDL
ncbi:MAG: hypothetical protein MSA25_09565 [Clostridiales bacterium]|nr:hypothetical protein [Clostridiales bacterium]